MESDQNFPETPIWLSQGFLASDVKDQNEASSATTAGKKKNDKSDPPPLEGIFTRDSSSMMKHTGGSSPLSMDSGSHSQDSSSPLVAGSAPSSASKSQAASSLKSQIKGKDFGHMKWSRHVLRQSKAALDSQGNPIEIHLSCEVDKGIKYSPEGFICQKKNHFQVTVHFNSQDVPEYTYNELGQRKRIREFALDIWGVKCENMDTQVRIDQSTTDRQKHAFNRIILDKELLKRTPVHVLTKTLVNPPFTPRSQDVAMKPGYMFSKTIGRLHFSETTQNNMRKRGMPNPDQKYFSIVIAIYAVMENESYVPLTSLISDRIIVRASNPGHFEGETNKAWSPGAVPNSVFVTGNVGINVPNPNEALCVDGNIRLTGSLLQPSDKRIKENIKPVNTSHCLRNICAMSFYTYQFTSAWAETKGVTQGEQCGVLAQELQTILPDAILEQGDHALKDGSEVDSLLCVNKDRLYMEALGAVQELAKETQELENLLWEQQNSISSQLQCQRNSQHFSILWMFPGIHWVAWGIFPKIANPWENLVLSINSFHAAAFHE
eukprot:m.12950 g.12950  ORF g.12950 m.12950 type:complete len:548 (-) comp4759_c0_seq1:47-1690(-)